MSQTPSACVLIIGNEVLSGRTPDANLNFLATRLGAAGIPVREARVIPDLPDEIIKAVNECRARYTYVFTTGGIGPTHDDITSECVGRAFGRSLEINPQALAMLKAYYDRQGTEINAARARMATVPVGSSLIENPLSGAPGFRLENVYVMAGIPKVMQAMFETVLPTLAGGPPVVMFTATCEIREGDLAADLERIQQRFPAVDIGSYPNVRAGRYITQLVCKSADAAAARSAHLKVMAMVRQLGGEPEEG